jgi:hypothetical protein
VAEKRNHNAFPLIFQSLRKLDLPNKNLWNDDDLYCWENVEFSLLTLEEDLFDEMHRRHWEELNNQKFVESVGDPIIDEIEQAFANGGDPAAAMQQFFSKYSS